jgi:DmsE family decaheme c-type cytochrome
VGGLVPFHLDTPEAVAEINESCLGCHSGGERTYWQASVHDANDLACTSCHVVMESVSESSLLSASTEVETCAGCHQVQHARSFRNAHMPLRDGAFQVSTASEGKMSCGSCHQPHGSVSESLISHISVNDQCLSCHAEKRGPFLWEHSPVPEDCLNCHDPHGGTRRAMLKMNVIRLCQSCHVSTGHATNPRAPNDRFAVGTACMQCHTQVHGSNHPSGFALTR